MKHTYYSLSECGGYIRPEGRITVCQRGILTDWSASGFTVNFIGSGVRLYTDRYRDEQPVCVMAILDGIRSKYAISDGNEPIVLECAFGLHTLTVLRLSEGAVPLYFTVMRISAGNADAEPSLLTPPEAQKRKLVFFGDSITCGYGNLGDNRKNMFYTFEEDPTKAYAYRTAELLHAEAELVSISGQGIVKNCLGEIGTPIPTFCKWQSRCLCTPHTVTRQPDAVIINAGTNDWGGGVSHEEFASGAEAFLKDLRAMYPEAEIVWFYGLMGLPYSRILDELISKLRPELGKLTYLPTAQIYEREGEVGANGHPSAEGAERGAHELAAKLADILGW